MLLQLRPSFSAGAPAGGCERCPAHHGWRGFLVWLEWFGGEAAQSGKMKPIKHDSAHVNICPCFQMVYDGAVKPAIL